MPLLLILLGLGAVLLVVESSASAAGPSGGGTPLTPTPGTAFDCTALRNGHDDIGDLPIPEQGLVCTTYYTSKDPAALYTLAISLDAQGYHTAAGRIRGKANSLAGSKPPPGSLIPGGGGHPFGPFAPFSPEAPAPALHELTDVDIAMGPIAFALAHGYTTVDDFAADNSNLTLVDPSGSGWPPVSFDVTVSLDGRTDRYRMTGRLDQAYHLPTYTNLTTGDTATEYVFPSFGTSLWVVDPSVSNTWDVGHDPAVVSGGSVPIVYDMPSTINPLVIMHRALIPWESGIYVKVRS